METKFKELTQEQIDLLNKPLPKDAIKPHPTKTFLSTIKAIYVTERLNDVFGVGKWTYTSEILDATGKMVLVKVFFEVPTYNIKYEAYGGNDNSDKGDALKGAVTDALTKIGSYMGIGAHVWKNEKVDYKEKGEEIHAPVTIKKADPVKEQSVPNRKKLTLDFFSNADNCNKFFAWLKNQIASKKMTSEDIINMYYKMTEEDLRQVQDMFKAYLLTNV